VSNTDKLTSAIETARHTLINRREVLRKEPHVESYLIEPILDSLGWNVRDYNKVDKRFEIGSKEVDYALLINRNAVAFIEAKRLENLTPKGQEQLFGYARKYNIDHSFYLLVFTDGEVWQFYLPSGPGVSNRDLLFCEFNIKTDDIDEIADNLKRFLSYETATGNHALNIVNDEWKKFKGIQTAKAQFPDFWNELTANPTEAGSLCKLVSKLFREASGHELSPKQIAQLIESHPKSGASAHRETADNGDAGLHSQTKSTKRKSPAPAQKLRVTYRNRRFSDINARVVFESVVKAIVRDYGIRKVAPLTHFLKTTAEMTKTATYTNQRRRRSWIDIPGTDYHLSLTNSTRGKADALKGIKKGLRISDSDFVIEVV